jgi:formylglycine-generating enzyme required for sulfatase activity
MAHVVSTRRDFCVDRWEASLVVVRGNGGTTPWPDNRAVDGVEDEVMAVSRPNVMPQGYINEVQAAHACARAGKRLCVLDEWRQACGGSAHRQYPYGNTRHARTCNDYDGGHPHPVMQLFNQFAAPGTPRSEMWNTTWMNDPRLHEPERGLLPTGASANCTNDYGVYDMVGNLHEWVDDPSGSFAGGFFMDTRINGEGCAYLTTAHSTTYHDYSTGFRCCSDASP